MAGYSGTPLARKLGIKQGMAVALVSAPAGFEIEGMPPGVRLVDAGALADLVLCFATEAATLDAAFREAIALIPPNGTIWTAWPKRASKVPTDITEDRLREMFLPTGFVDVKVCAIDDTWSGLKFVLRKELRS